MVFEATSAGGSASRNGGASLDAEVVNEAARAALASVLDVGEETISVSSSRTGNLRRVDYALVGTYPEMLVARDGTQGMADGNGVLEAALDDVLGSLSVRLVPGSVLADRGQLLIGSYPVTNTLTSTTLTSITAATSYQPSANLLDGDGSQEASAIMVLILIVLGIFAVVAIAVCFAPKVRKKLWASRHWDLEINGFDTIYPTSAWGCDDGGKVSGAPPRKEEHHQVVQPGQLPDTYVRW